MRFHQLLLCLTAVLAPVIHAQEYLIMGAAVADPETQYKFWSFERVEVLARNDVTKQRFPGWHRRHHTAVLMGHGHAADVGGWGYDEMYPLIVQYDKVMITGCAQNYAEAEKMLWRLWGGAGGQVNKYRNCVVADAAGVYTLDPNGGGCRGWVTLVTNPAPANDVRRAEWAQAQATMAPILRNFREKVVFLTPRVLNMVLPAAGAMQLWLTPSDAQANALIGAGGAAALDWQVSYAGIPNAPALNNGVSTRTAQEVATFRAGVENTAHIARLAAKQAAVAVHPRGAGQTRLENLDAATLAVLPADYNGVPQYARVLSAAAEAARVLAAQQAAAAAAAQRLRDEQARAEGLAKVVAINNKENVQKQRRNSIGLLFIQRHQKQQQTVLQP